MPKSLHTLLAGIPADQILATSGDLATPISAPVVESSLEVEPGGLFVARAGQSHDGHAFIPDAIAAGAAAIVGETEAPELPVPYIRVKGAEQVLGLLAAAYHDFPSRKLVVIGVTGTDGKTTTCLLLHSILKRSLRYQSRLHQHDIRRLRRRNSGHRLARHNTERATHPGLPGAYGRRRA